MENDNSPLNTKQVGMKSVCMPKLYLIIKPSQNEPKSVRKESYYRCKIQDRSHTSLWTLAQHKQNKGNSNSQHIVIYK